MTNKLLSNCCNAEMISNSYIENGGDYLCGNCHKPCDPASQPLKEKCTCIHSKITGITDAFGCPIHGTPPVVAGDSKECACHCHHTDCPRIDENSGFYDAFHVIKCKHCNPSVTSSPVKEDPGSVSGWEDADLYYEMDCEYSEEESVHKVLSEDKVKAFFKAELSHQKKEIREKAQQKVKQYKKDVLRADTTKILTQDVKYAIVQGAEETLDSFFELLEDKDICKECGLTIEECSAIARKLLED